MNLWHNLEPGRADLINVIIEINRGSKNKYEIDKTTGLIALDRVAHTAQDFPFDYGFVPQTLWHDDDPLDVIVLTTHPLLPGVLVRVRPVGLMKMVDSGQGDDKLISVPADDPRWESVRDLGDVNTHTLKEMEHFYSTYKKLQDKVVTVNGFENRAAAEAAFATGVELYKKKFNQK
ncbi:MAG: inorganic diphosphatase [Patescibacteria group bacterium]